MKMKKFSFLILLFFIAAFTSCSSDNDSNNDPNNGADAVKINFRSIVADGSVTETTTKLILTFDKDIEGLIADDITLTTGTIDIVKGTLNSKGSGIYELAVSDISVSGEVTVVINKAGYMITPASKTVMVYYVKPVKQVAFNSLSTNGSITETTSKIILMFDKDVEGLTADDITLTTGTTNIVKGLLETKGSGKYELAVNNISEGGEVTVIVNKAGYEISPTSRKVTVYYVNPEEQVAFLNLTANGSATETTTKLILKFDKDIPMISYTDIILTTANTGAVIKELSSVGSGVYELKVRDLIASGEVTVTLGKTGYKITPASKTVTVYYKNIIGDFYYSDGTHSTQKDAAKDCIGIVFWQDPDNSTKGKIVSLDEHYGNPKALVRWAASKKGGWRLSTKDDLQQLWCAYNGAKFVTWGVGKDAPRPAVNTAAQAVFNSLLTTGGGVAITNTYYWSSTSSSTSDTFSMDFKDGRIAIMQNNSSFKGRAVSYF